jgi:hypothetical protein
MLVTPALAGHFAKSAQYMHGSMHEGWRSNLATTILATMFEGQQARGVVDDSRLRMGT